MNFNTWTSNLDLSLLRMVAHFLTIDIYEFKTFLLALPKIKNQSGEEQARVLAGVLNDYKIDVDKLGWFVLDSASNNDTTLFELFKSILLDLQKKKQLRCAGHIINLIAIVFLYSQHLKNIERQLTLDQSKILRLIL